jgi:hypothetical protein
MRVNDVGQRRGVRSPAGSGDIAWLQSGVKP